jgi:hypothetical protein
MIELIVFLREMAVRPQAPAKVLGYLNLVTRVLR